jgi:hypothetical protein
MNLSDRQRKMLFAGLVVVLSAVGVYLTLAAPTRDSGDDDAGGSPPSASAAPTGPVSPPPGIGGSVSPQDFDVYRLLPFSRREFATAAALAQRFTAAYGTRRWDEDPRAYIGRLAPMVTEELLLELQRGQSASGLVDNQRRQRLSSRGSATLDQVRDIEDNSIMFLVTGDQQVTRNGRQGRQSEQYLVTVARDGATLRVYAFAPADVGQPGEVGRQGDTG